MKSILELAKEHQVKCYYAKHGISSKGKSTKYRDQDVQCQVCQRWMTAPKHENPPFYCYQCDEEAEAIQRDSGCIDIGEFREPTV